MVGCGSIRATLLGLRLLLPLLLPLLLARLASSQQLLLARRDPRSLFEEHPLEQLPPLGWNSVGGGYGVGQWAYNPVGLGHMTKDELLTLLEAWKEVEQEQEQEQEKTTAQPAESTTRRPPPPPPPPPSPPRPIPIPMPIPISIPMPAPVIPSGAQITARLPAFLPIRLAAVFTPPGDAGAGGTGGGAAAGTDDAGGGGDDLASDNGPHDDASPHLFRFMAMPRTQSQSQSQPRQQFVVRNTLDSVDAGTAPVRQQVKPEVRPKAVAVSPPSSISIPSPMPISKAPAPFFRPRFGVPPHLAHARFELVPSSQVIGDWRE
ncbi:protein enabled homolog [Drosophila elegans]|uniref:protein enabled homolog n=1 Tax=Drosophila elegans TaxID=30023 RepID=UPI0007E770CF|nr:protein enabled homolog [Drosophila elegans]